MALPPPTSTSLLTSEIIIHLFRALMGLTPEPISSLPYDGVKEAVTGWRLWRVKGHQLYSANRSTEWLPGVPMTGSFDNNSSAGVYAFKDKEEAYHNLIDYDQSNYGAYVLGSVEMWGTVVEHNRGYRAERARIATLDAATARVDLDTLRSLYINRRCPSTLTPVFSRREDRVVGVMNLVPPAPRRWNPYLMMMIAEERRPFVVAEPFSFHVLAFPPQDWGHRAEHFTTQTHFWRGDELLLEEGQHPEWLPGWVPLPEKKVKQP